MKIAGALCFGFVYAFVGIGALPFLLVKIIVETTTFK